MAQNGFRFKFLSVMLFIYYMKYLKPKAISDADELQTIPMISLAQTWANIKEMLSLSHSLYGSPDVNESQAIADDINRR